MKKEMKKWIIGFILFGSGLIWCAIQFTELFLPTAFLCIGIVLMLEADNERCFKRKDA